MSDHTTGAGPLEDAARLQARPHKRWAVRSAVITKKPRTGLQEVAQTAQPPNLFIVRLLLHHSAPRLCAALLWLTCWEHALVMQICQLTRVQENRSSSEDRGVDTRDRSARGVSSKCAISRSWLNFTDTSPCSFAMLARLPPRYGWCSLAKADTGAWDKTRFFVVSSSSYAHLFLSC